jgi:Tol biopolymer transport system component
VWTDGKLEKLDGKVSEGIQSLVYPYWHPSGDYVAFSTNKTNQMFHMKDKNRIEVFDSASDVLVYDVKNHRVLTDSLLFSKGAFETFPSFSPDGKTLYFSSAKAQQMPKDYKKVKYSLCAISFNPQTGQFGNQVDTLFSAETEGKSGILPRVSSDGRFLAFTQADYGNFAIWHKEADLCLIDLSNGQVKGLPEVNSTEAESYHAWSSNGRWLVFASRRDDGLYSRPYIAYIDENGQGHKPFVVPQHTPDFYQNSMVSFNVPEFIKEPVTLDRKLVVETAKEGKAMKVTAP